VPCRQRLVENSSAFLVLCANGKMRIEQGRSLPEQQFERPAATGRSGLVTSWLVVGLGQTGMGQELSRKRSSKAKADHFVCKGATRHPTRLYRRYQLAQTSLVHRTVCRLNLRDTNFADPRGRCPTRSDLP